MKMKELRGLFLTVLLLIVDLTLFIFALVTKEKMKLVASILILPVILLIHLRQFYVRASKDCILIYRFIGPFGTYMLLEYQDIQEIVCKNTYCIHLKTKDRTYPIYVLHADKKINELRQLWEDYHETH